MSNSTDKIPTIIDDEDTYKPQKVTDELPAIFRYPMKAIAWGCRQTVMANGFLMAFTFGAVVLIRYGFGGDLFAYEEWLLAFCIIGFFAGSVLASARNLHINADILGVVIQSPRLIWWRGLVVLLVELFVVLFMVYACSVSLLDDFSFPRLRATPVLRIPFATWRIAIMCGFGFMGMFIAAYLYVHIRKGLGLPLRSETLKGASK